MAFNRSSQSVALDQSFDVEYHGTTNHIVPSSFTLYQSDSMVSPTLTLSMRTTRSGGDSYWSESWQAYLFRNGTLVDEKSFTMGSYSTRWTSISCSCSFTVDFGTLDSASFQITVKNPDGSIELVFGPGTFTVPVLPSLTLSKTTMSPGESITITVECDPKYTYQLCADVSAPSPDRRYTFDYFVEDGVGDHTYQYTPDPDTICIGLPGKGHGNHSWNDNRAEYSYILWGYFDGIRVLSCSVDATMMFPSFGDVSLPSELTAGAANTITLTDPGGYGYSLILTAAEDSVTAPALTETGSWTPAASAFAPLMPDSMSKTFSCKVQTYYHSVLVGKPFALSDVTVRLREIDVCPQPTAVIEDDAELRATYGDYVLLQSRLHITASAGLRYGATLETLKIIANGTYYTGAEAITEVLESLDYDTVAIEVTDSRGVTAVTEYTISIVEWFTPRVTALAVHRCTSAGVLNDSGDHVLIEWGVSFAPVNDHNTRVLTVHHPEGSSVVTLSAYQQTGQMIVAADTEHSYNISLTLQDAFATFTRTVRLSTAGVILDILSGGKGVAFGKVAETQAALEVCPDWTLICQTLKLAGVDLGTWMQAIEQRLERGGI